MFRSSCRETLLQALRGVIAGAGQKMGDPIRKTLTTTLLDLLGHGDVRTVKNFGLTTPLMSRITRKYCLTNTSYLTEKFVICILLTISDRIRFVILNFYE